MRFRGALVLMCLALLAGGVYFLYVIPAQKEAERERELRERLFNATESEIDLIRLANRGNAYELRKESNTWMVVRPRRLIADKRIIEKIIEALNEERIIKVVATDLGRMDEFGLKNPLVYAGFGHGNQFDEFLVGRPSPAKSGAYLYKKGLDGIFLVSVDVPNSLNQDLYGIRKKEPFVFERASIVKIALERPSGGIVLEKTGSGWMMEYPLQVRGSDDDISALLEELVLLRAEEFFDDYVPDPSAYGSAVKVKLGTASGEEAILDIYFWGTEQDRGLMLYQRGAGYAARTHQRKIWNKVNDDPAVYRYRSLIGSDAEEVYEIEGVGNNNAMTLKREGDRWTSAGKKLPEGEVELMIAAMKSLKAVRFVADRDFKREKLLFSLVLKDGNGKEIDNIRVYGKNDEEVSPYKMSVFDGPVYFVEALNLSDKGLIPLSGLKSLSGSFFILPEEVSK